MPIVNPFFSWFPCRLQVASLFPSLSEAIAVSHSITGGSPRVEYFTARVNANLVRLIYILIVDCEFSIIRNPENNNLHIKEKEKLL